MDFKINYTKNGIILSIVIMLVNQIILPVKSNISTEAMKQFLISTKGCKIPSYPLISDKIENLIVSNKGTNCNENMHLLNYNSTHIWIAKDSLDIYNVLSTNDFYCCYRYFYAENRIEQIIYGKCVEFTTVIEATHEFTRVECFYLDNKIYDDFFLFHKLTRPQETNKTQPAFNILFFGIESMSRMNFLRMMPKTSMFLREKGSIQLLGYNKVGDNSYPNLFPFLLGKSFGDTKKSCVMDNVINGSECVFIWTKFKEAGYHTALGSDSIAGLLDTYEYSLPKIPTDFYLQPFLFETRNLFENTRYAFHQCLQNKYFYKLLLNWSAELLKQSYNKLFGIFWEESISHEHFNLPQSMDDDHFNFLKELDSSRYLDDTILVFFSDHGMRWGEIAQTEQGRVENRLPLFEILFPTEFQRRYHLAFSNFKQNGHRLTSPYDIHETMLDLVHGNLYDDKIKMRSNQMNHVRSGMSLFLPAPIARTCKSIGISEHWCTCQENEYNVRDMDVKQKIKAAHCLIQHINTLLKKQPKCHQLKVGKIFNATVTKDETNKILKYWIVLQTSPGGGIFDATLHPRGKKLYVSDTVTRLNLYRFTSQCIQDQDDVVKMYCTCQ